MNNNDGVLFESPVILFYATMNCVCYCTLSVYYIRAPWLMVMATIGLLANNVHILTMLCSLLQVRIHVVLGR